ncbi:MAG: MFS transporter [Halobacteriales archaeon]
MIRGRPELAAPALLTYLATGVAMLGTAAMSPVLPAMQGALGVGDARIGLVMSAFTAAVAVTVPLQGWLADRYGRRPVLGGNLLLFGLAGTATFVAPDFRTVLALRALQGAGFAGVLPLVVTVVSDMFGGDAEVGAQGLRVTAVNLGGFLFPVLTGALVAVAWNVPFLLFAGAVPVGLAVLFRLPEPASARRPEGNYVRAVLTAGRRPLVAIAVALGTLRFFTLYAIYTYLPLLIVARGLGAGRAGVVIGAVNATKMLVATQSRRTTALAPPRVTLAAAVLVSLLVVAAFPAAGSFPAFLLVAVGLGAVEGVSAPLQKTVLTRYAPAPVRAGVVSLNAAVQNVGKTAGPVAVGVVVAAAGLPASFVLLGAGGALVAGGLLAATALVGATEPAP